MRFELVKMQRYRKREDLASCRISKSGRIKFNEVAVREFLVPVLKGNITVALAYDKRSHDIAILPFTSRLSSEDRRVIPFKVIEVNGGKERSIPAKPFFDRIGLTLPETGLEVTLKIENDDTYASILVLSVHPGDSSCVD